MKTVSWDGEKARKVKLRWKGIQTYLFFMSTSPTRNQVFGMTHRSIQIHYSCGLKQSNSISHFRELCVFCYFRAVTELKTKPDKHRVTHCDYLFVWKRCCFRVNQPILSLLELHWNEIHFLIYLLLKRIKDKTIQYFISKYYQSKNLFKTTTFKLFNKFLHHLAQSRLQNLQFIFRIPLILV